MRNHSFRSDCRLRSAAAISAAFFVVLGWSLTPALADHAQYYVLDGFGGVHAGGGAPALSPATPYFGFDIAKDIAFVPVGTSTGSGNGVLVLDGFGGVHEGGALTLAPVSPKTPYFGFNIARAITYRNIPPRANFTATNTGDINVTSSTNVVVASTTLTLPDDGIVLILANLAMGNNSSTSGDNVIASICVGVNGTVCLAGIERDIAMDPFVDSLSLRSESVIQGAFLSAGSHTFNFLVRRRSLTGTVTYSDPTISAIYVDQESMGTSAPSGLAATGLTGTPIGH